ncbi:nadh:ubiquinone oxidoreductase subunit [Colletotrichum truncatum]|uniref:Nadh:ubiquinone oxidoreductase subunit n=1 Tax=Colletotrichum truncatum TaxID=5467 RepID=A0ACC3YJ79_COLTU|nr:nadh:ubiquinone oxidoreductase subunit [Colletotrichum truncatum]KAF6797189.1 nadh:ubiquinone oxidoreductase subunit [Colletotrichum truncatum]
MAGGVEHHKLALDPALVKLGHMQSNRHIFFRWTPRTARISFIYIAVVPAIIGYIGYKSDGLFDLRAKRKGDLIYER